MQKDSINTENSHAISLEDLYYLLKTSEGGLTTEVANERLAKFGKNQIEEKGKINILSLLLNQFKSLLVAILLAAALISYLTDHLADAVVILLVIIINAAIGFIQEYRADRSIRALKKLLVLKSKVIRDGKLTQIDASNLVPGDIIIVEEGDKIPADARIIRYSNLRTIESSITGESLPVDKDDSVAPLNSSIGDRKNMLWTGTICVNGKAHALVVATGGNTVIGKIASKVQEIKDTKSHFSEITSKLSKQMGFIAILGSIIIFVVGFFIQKIEFSEIFLFSIASLVSAIPEGLPAVLTIVLAIGSYRMAKRKAIIRDLKISETLGIVNVIATDKTGTLTQNTMSIEEIYLPSKEKYIVTGKGWELKGKFLKDGKEDEVRDNLKTFVTAGFLSNSSKIIHVNGGVEIIGDPTEVSFKVLGYKAGLDPDIEDEIIFDLPFSTEYKYRAQLTKDGKVYIVGAPEVLLSLTKKLAIDGKEVKIKEFDQKELLNQVKEMSQKALRVLAIGVIKLDEGTKEITHDDIKSITLLGLAGMKDPVRPETKEAVEKAIGAGIRVIMLTGDHKETALAVAKEINLQNSDIAYTEGELSQMNDSEFVKACLEVNIFARLNPETKLRIAKVLQENGYVLAMTGDGINDAPALRQADVGISMGMVGTDTAREASEIVLSDDNFASIVSAVEEGRLVFNNVKRASTFLITTNIAEQITILLTLFLGYPLPLLASQILWLNLVTDGINDFALSTEKSHGTVLKSRPRDKHEGILTKSTIWFVLVMSVVMVSLTLFFFTLFLDQGVDEARTVAFLCMSFTQLFNAINLRSFTKSIFKIGLLTNKFVFIAFIISGLLNILAVYYEPLRDLLSFAYVDPLTILLIFILSSFTLWIGEIAKMVNSLRKDQDRLFLSW